MWIFLRCLALLTVLCWTASLASAQGYTASRNNASPLVASASAQTRYSTISGIVIDSAGNSVTNATVEIFGRLPFSSILLRTSDAGSFMTDSLIAGDTYTVAVMRLGFHATETRPFVANATTPHILKIVLKPRSIVTIPAKTNQGKSSTRDNRVMSRSEEPGTLLISQ